MFNLKQIKEDKSMINKELINKWVGQTDHQWEMRSRLVDAYGKLDESDEDEWHQIVDFMQVFCTLGMKSMIHEALDTPLPKIEIDKVKLELDFKGQGYPTESDYNKITSRLNEIRSRRKRYWEKFEAIQNHHGVTGLEPHPCDLGDKTIIHPTYQDNELPLIPTDIEVLRQWKPKMIDFWKQYVVENELKIYRYQEQSKINETTGEVIKSVFTAQKQHPYVESSFEEIDAIATLSDWAEVWDWDDDMPHLDLGTGIDIESSGCRVEFVAVSRYKTKYDIPL